MNGKTGAQGEKNHTKMKFTKKKEKTKKNETVRDLLNLNLMSVGVIHIDFRFKLVFV